MVDAATLTDQLKVITSLSTLYVPLFVQLPYPFITIEHTDRKVDLRADVFGRGYGVLFVMNNELMDISILFVPPLMPADNAAFTQNTT